MEMTTSPPQLLSGDRGDLNPRPPGPQPGALTELSYGHRENGSNPWGTPGRIRTSDQELRRLLLCPLSYGGWAGKSDGWCVVRSEPLTRPDPAISRPITHRPPPTTQSGAGEGNRTLMTSLEGWSSAIELHPQEDRILMVGDLNHRWVVQGDFLNLAGTLAKPKTGRRRM